MHLPHAADLSGDLRPIPLEAEHDILLPVRPAGGLWSTAREMARFVQTELAGGIAPSGTRVVSAANLAATWAPRVAVPNFYGGPPEMAVSMSDYGLGWMSGEYRGVRVISLTGGTTGLTAQLHSSGSRPRHRLLERVGVTGSIGLHIPCPLPRPTGVPDGRLERLGHHQPIEDGEAADTKHGQQYGLA